MGNRAVITTPDNPVGIYVHWNGGIESVLGFTHAALALDVRSPSSGPSYFLARLSQIIGNFFGGTTSVGIGLTNKMDSSDNGIWVEKLRHISGYAIAVNHTGEQISVSLADIYQRARAAWGIEPTDASY